MIKFISIGIFEYATLIHPIKQRNILIEGYEHYTISYWSGILVNTRTGKISNGWINEQRYRRIKLSNGKNYTNQYFQRIAAITWLPNYKNKEEVNHLDRIRDNNDVPNLAWVSHAENMAYIKCELLVEEIDKAPF